MTVRTVQTHNTFSGAVMTVGSVGSVGSLHIHMGLCPRYDVPMADSHTCSVEGCHNPATFEVLLYDEYRNGEVFEEIDFTCPLLCDDHKKENEAGADGPQTPRRVTSYPFTNRQGAQGFSKYRRL